MSLTYQAWRQLAEHIAESLERGPLAIVSGRLRQRSQETQDGEKRTVYKVQVDESGPALRKATAKITKVSRNGHDQSPGADEVPRGPGGGPPFRQLR